MSKRIIVTGSRYYKDVSIVHKWLNRVLLNLHPDDKGTPTLIHGGAEGADAIADKYWKSLGYPVEVYEADWESYGKAAGPMRNRRMAESGADICVAFPKGESRGTRGMMKLAEEYGITVLDVEKAEELGLYHES